MSLGESYRRGTQAMGGEGVSRGRGEGGWYKLRVRRAGKEMANCRKGWVGGANCRQEGQAGGKLWEG